MNESSVPFSRPVRCLYICVTIGVSLGLFLDALLKVKAGWLSLCFLAVQVAWIWWLESGKVFVFKSIRTYLIVFFLVQLVFITALFWKDVDAVEWASWMVLGSVLVLNIIEMIMEHRQKKT